MKCITALRIEISSYLWVLPILLLIVDLTDIAMILFVIFIIHLVIGLYVSSRDEKNVV